MNINSQYTLSKHYLDFIGVNFHVIFQSHADSKSDVNSRAHRELHITCPHKIMNIESPLLLSFLLASHQQTHKQPFPSYLKASFTHQLTQRKTRKKKDAALYAHYTHIASSYLISPPGSPNCGHFRKIIKPVDSAPAGEMLVSPARTRVVCGSLEKGGVAPDFRKIETTAPPATWRGKIRSRAADRSFSSRDRPTRPPISHPHLQPFFRGKGCERASTRVRFVDSHLGPIFCYASFQFR